MEPMGASLVPQPPFQKGGGREMFGKGKSDNRSTSCSSALEFSTGAPSSDEEGSPL